MAPANVLSLRVVLLSVVVSAIAYPAMGQTRSWAIGVSGSWDDATRWAPADAPDSASESAAFGITGSYTARLDDASPTVIGALDATAGGVTLQSLGAGDATLKVLGDASVDDAEVTLARSVLSSEVAIEADGDLSLSDTAAVFLTDGASLSAATTTIEAGGALAPTSIQTEDNATADLGTLTIANAGGGAFEGSVTVVGDSVVTVDGLHLATTGVVERLGIVQVFANGSFEQASGVAEIGAATGEGLGLLAVGGQGHVRLDDARVRATGEVRAIGGTIHFETGLLIDGGIYTQSSAVQTFGPSAEIAVRNTARVEFNAQPLVLTNGQSLEILDSTVSAAGGVDIDGGVLSVDDASHLDGDLRLASDATLEVTLGEPAPTGGAFSISGAAAIAGSLVVSEGVGFSPEAGDAFPLLSATAITGGFADVRAPALPSGLAWRLASGATTLSLEVVAIGAPGDFNADGVVDAADYTAWRDTHGDVGPLLPADGDGSGEVDDGDLVVWASDYGAGSQPMAIPEPTTASLAVLLVAIARRIRRPNR